MRRRARAHSVLLAVAVAALGATFGAGSARAEAIRSFEVDLFLESDGSYTVEETIVYDFEGARRHGIYREIQLDRGRGWLVELPLRLDVESVTDATDRSRAYRVDDSPSQVNIRIGDADRWVSGVEHYRIRYEVHRGILFHEENDELYWNVTGNGWAVPIERAQVTIYLPPGNAAQDLPVRCFTGPPGSTRSDCSFQAHAESVVVTSEGRLGNGSGLTVALAIPKGAIAEPGLLDRLAERLRALGGPWLLAPFAALAGMGALWRQRGQDPELGVAVPVRYEPPEGLSPAEVGTILDESADLDDVTSTILDLAVRGFLRLEEVPTQSFLFFSASDWRLVRLHAGPFVPPDPEAHRDPNRAVDPTDPTSLRKHERMMLNGLFQQGDQVLLSSLRTKFHERLDKIVVALYSELSGRNRHFVDSPRLVRRRWMGVAVAVGVGAVAGGFTGVLAVPSAICAGAAAAVIAFFARAMPRRTRKGRRVLEEILGFREFVSRVNADLLEREGLRAPEEFERLLPYAIVLGVADHWADLFADLYTAPPAWYRSSRGNVFHPGEFVTDLGRALDTMGRTLSSTPQKSGGSSGFGGGGMSGGGFGGGGGGSW